MTQPVTKVIEVAEVAVEPAGARVYEHGWQSWSPTTSYRLGQRPHRPRNDRNHTLAYRPGVTAPDDAFQGEGLLAIDPGDEGPVHVFAASDGRTEVPSVRAVAAEGVVRVAADGPVEHLVDSGGGGIDAALARWADTYAARSGVAPPRPAPTLWCSWYHYFTAVTETDMVENLAAMDALDLPIDVVQLDDGYQSEIGDWLFLSDRFGSLADLIGRITQQHGRRAGIWVAPFLVGSRSRLAAEHPDWLVGGGDGPADAGHNWHQDLFALDVSHPQAATYLTEVFTTLAGLGIDLFKIDFVFAGALDGRRHGDIDGLGAYRMGVELIRSAIGRNAYLLGCGAPILPSVGLFDAMRISPDTSPHSEPDDGDPSQPSARAAELTGKARAFQHGRFWTNDADCLLARPAVQRRQQWAAHVERYGGLRASSDRLADLDGWGLETTRRLLSEPPPRTFVDA